MFRLEEPKDTTATLHYGELQPLAYFLTFAYVRLGPRQNETGSL